MRRSGLPSCVMVWSKPLPTCCALRGFSPGEVVSSGLPARPRNQRSAMTAARSAATPRAIQRAALMRPTVRMPRVVIRRASGGARGHDGRTRIGEVEHGLAGEAVALEGGEDFEVAVERRRALFPAPTEQWHAVTVGADGERAQVAAAEGAR